MRSNLQLGVQHSDSQLSSSDEGKSGANIPTINTPTALESSRLGLMASEASHSKGEGGGANISTINVLVLKGGRKMRRFGFCRRTSNVNRDVKGRGKGIMVRCRLPRVKLVERPRRNKQGASLFKHQ